jgi:hypothetical protein
MMWDRPLWFDRQGQPISYEEGARLLADGDARRVAQDVVIVDGEPTWVSTVHLVLNHNWGDGPPLIFETMTFAHDGPIDMVYRYPTEAAALAGHDQAVAELREKATHSS